MVEGRVLESSKQEKFQIACMAEERVPQTSRQERFQVLCIVEKSVPQSNMQKRFQVPCIESHLSVLRFLRNMEPFLSIRLTNPFLWVSPVHLLGKGVGNSSTPSGDRFWVLQ